MVIIMWLVGSFVMCFLDWKTQQYLSFSWKKWRLVCKNSHPPCLLESVMNLQKDWGWEFVFFFFLTNDTLDGPDMLGSLNRFHSLYIKCVASDTKKVPINPTLNSSERVDKCHPTPSPSVASLFFHPKQSHLHSEHHTYPTLEHYKSDASKLQRFSHKLCTHRFQLPSGDSKCKHAL